MTATKKTLFQNSVGF